MITDCYDITTKPIISWGDYYGEQKYLVDKCFILFSKEIHTHLLNTFSCEEIAVFSASNGDTPVYKMNYKGTDIAFYLSALGSSLAASLCYKANWLIGATKFIMFGSCGSLDGEKTHGRYIIPTESYRGEGCSYYFKEPSDYIDVKNSQKVASVFKELKMPYVLGRVWTTDSVIRETVGLVTKRKEEGCVAVEMELAGVQAACDFYGLELYDFLEAGDVLEADGYEMEGQEHANHDLGKLYIGLEVALRV